MGRLRIAKVDDKTDDGILRVEIRDGVWIPLNEIVNERCWNGEYLYPGKAESDWPRAFKAVGQSMAGGQPPTYFRSTTGEDYICSQFSRLDGQVPVAVGLFVME